MRRTARTFALVASLAALGVSSVARGDEPPAGAAKLPMRSATLAWDAPKDAPEVLRATLAFRDVLDPAISAKLSSGLPTVIATRVYVFADGQDAPIALAVRTCRVVYDLWDEVYRLSIVGSSGPRDVATVSVEGVARQCAEVRELSIVARAALKKSSSYFLGVIVDVNPVSPEMLEQMRRWVSRPTGSTNLTPSDALFGSFVGLFVRGIGASDRTLRFRTQSFSP